MENWPSSLPKPDLNFKCQTIAGLADDQEQINSIRTRTYPERKSSFTLILSQTQFETLQIFYETTLNGGGELFEADWLTDVGFTFHRLQFLSPFKAVLQNGMYWIVEIDLKIIASVPFEDSDPAYWLCIGDPPAPPTNVQASDGTFTDKVYITWLASEGATSYKVYRSDTIDGEKTLKGSPSDLFFDDITAIALVVYYYWVKAQNSNGASDFSSSNTGYREEGAADENAYIYGGYDSTFLQDCDHYTPDTWASKSNMPSPGRISFSASTISSSGYIYAGRYDSGYLQDCDQYTPDVWTSKTNMPTPARYALTASTISSSGYVYGGQTPSYLQDCDQYTPDVWTSKTDISTPTRSRLAASTIGSSSYIYGGYNPSYLRDCDQYTPNTWVSKTDIPTPARAYLAASTIGSSGYIYGGYNLQDCDEYTPDTWVGKSNIPLPARYLLTASTIGSAGFIYGGNDDSNYLQDCDQYVPDTWTSKTDIPTPARDSLSASTI